MRNFWGVTDDISLAFPDHIRTERYAKEFLFNQHGTQAPPSFRLSRKRVVVFGLFLGIVVCSLVARTMYLQFFRGIYYRSLAEGNRVRIERIGAMRGGGVDREGTMLVKNSPSFTLAVIKGDLPQDIQERKKIYDHLAQYAGMEASAIQQLVEYAPVALYEDIPIRTNVPYSEALPLILESRALPGVVIREGFFREYPCADVCAHFLGYVGNMTKGEWSFFQKKGYQYSDIVGKIGLEKQYETVLRGIDGNEKIEVDAWGKRLESVAITPPEKCAVITLSLSLPLQRIVTDVVGRVAEEVGAKKAAAVFLDPRNGEVLALVSIPSFDNNRFIQGLSSEEYIALARDPYQPLFQRAISGEYPSGSTIKPIFAAGALQEKIVTPQFTVQSSGGLHIGSWVFPDWKPGGHGITDMRKAIAESVNTYFYLIGGGDQSSLSGLGVNRMREYAELFGLGTQTGIDVGGEAQGFLPSPEWKLTTKGERWYLGDTYHFVIGQGDVLVTPLQIASMMSVFANNGTVYRPHLVHAINGIDVQPVVERENFIDKEYLTTVRLGLRDTAVWGSARSLSQLPIAVAGKTGTSQFSTDKKPHAWFTGFAPFDRPQVAFVVLIEEGDSSNVAVQAVREILSQWHPF